MQQIFLVRLPFLLVLLLACIVLPRQTYSQSLTNVRLSETDKHLVVTYDLVEKVDLGTTYTLAVYASHDQFSKPLPSSVLTGQVGRLSKPGKDLQLQIDKAKAFEGFKGELQVDLEVTPTPAPWKLAKDAKFKRGKSTTVTWRGGTPADMVLAEVYGTEGKVVIDQKINTGNSTWKVPDNFSVKEGYELRLLVNNTVVASQAIRVKRKVPLVVKFAPLLLVGALIPALPKDKEETFASPPQPN